MPGADRTQPDRRRLTPGRHGNAAALQVRATQPGGAASGRALADPLTAAEQRVLTLLPTSTHLQIADTPYVSRNTVKPISGRSTRNSG